MGESVRRMTKLISAACTLFVYSGVAVAAATVSRHGVSMEYDPQMVLEAVCSEKAAKPRPPNHPSRIERDFTPAELTFSLVSRSKIGGASVSLSPTTHRNVDYYDQAYPDLAPEIEKLKQLLRDRPRHPERDKHRRTIHPLSQHPYYLISKVRYFDFPWGSAIGFLNFDAQDAGNPAGFDPQIEWTRLGYNIYGLTGDGRFYVSGSLKVVHPELERGENKRLLINGDVRGDEYNAYLDRATRLMEQAADESFSPHLTVLHKLMSSISFDAKHARPEKWHRFRDRRRITPALTGIASEQPKLEDVAPARAAK